MMPVHQVDLDVAQARVLPQVVLAHQSIEIDRRGRAGVDLVVADFRQLFHHVRELIEQTRSSLGGAALRQIGDDLKLGLVVERQHLQHHQLRCHQSDGEHDGRQDPPVEFVPTPAAAFGLQERTDQACEQALHPALLRLPGLARRSAVLPAEQDPAQPGREDQRHGQRNHHPHAGIDRNRTHVRAHQARDESHRQQRCDHGEGGQYRRPADLIDRAPG